MDHAGNECDVVSTAAGCFNAGHQTTAELRHSVHDVLYEDKFTSNSLSDGWSPMRNTTDQQIDLIRLLNERMFGSILDYELSRMLSDLIVKRA